MIFANRSKNAVQISGVMQILVTVGMLISAPREALVLRMCLVTVRSRAKKSDIWCFFYAWGVQ